MVYFLVSPSHFKDISPRPFFWMRDGGDRWVNFVKGKWPFKSDGDIVLERVKTSDMTELNWGRTALYDNKSSSGWLSRVGRFYGCPANYHDKFAAYVLGIKVDKLENTGWARILDYSSYSTERNLSHEQNSWLTRMGYRIYED